MADERPRRGDVARLFQGAEMKAEDPVSDVETFLERGEVERPIDVQHRERAEPHRPVDCGIQAIEVDGRHWESPRAGTRTASNLQG